MNEPIMLFANDEELQRSLAEWKLVVGLQDWIISAEIDDMDDAPEDGGDVCYLAVEKSAHLRIHRDDCYVTLRGKNVRKAPQELTLIHELLHCKVEILESTQNNYDAQVVNWRIHTLIEDMARSLIMAKYHIPFTWFEV